MALVITVDYLAGIYIEKTEDKKKKKIFFSISIITTILILFIFKYFNFFNANFAKLADVLHWNYSIAALSLLLPIGLSFHTFQSLSYVVEVYRGKQKAEKNFGIYSLYVMFYPQLVAGPIERPQNLLHQFYEEHNFNYNDFADGLKLMLWGFFMKVVIADRLAIVVNTVYNNPTNYTGIPLIVATVFFAFQIFCDFAGYSTIAIGIARVMGFRLMKNFNRPYFSKSIHEFWRRWHISLSTWFKDYIYIPLGGNRVTVSRWYYNLFIISMISGLWHGANWTFIIWGALHAFYSIFSLMTQNIRAKAVQIFRIDKTPIFYSMIQIGVTFILVNIGWIFFRANSLGDAWYILTHIHIINGINDSIQSLGLRRLELLIALISITFMIFIHILQEKKSVMSYLSSKPTWVKWTIYLIFINLILSFGVFNYTQFIYFQF
ncbi:MAG: MBOAT family O-acyltransferase [Candidatus Methanoperedens sp.]